MNSTVILGRLRTELERGPASSGRADAGIRVALRDPVPGGGLSPTGTAGVQRPAPTIAIDVFDPPYPDGLPPATLAWAGTRRDSRGSWVRFKVLGHPLNHDARTAARAAGAMDALFLNEKNELAECASSNIFLVAGGRLHTPSIRAGVLPGVTRAAVIELARELGIPVAKPPLGKADLAEADEVFITSSLKEVLAVGRVGDRTVGGGVEGPVTKKLRLAYRDAAQA